MRRIEDGHGIGKLLRQVAVALVTKRLITDRQHLVKQQDVCFDRHSDREGEPLTHAG